MCRPPQKSVVDIPTVEGGGFHFGHLKVLLGKPGTLHSPGHIFPSALGVPPDLRDASGFFRRLDKYLGRVGMWLRPHRSRGSGVPQLPGKGRSLTPSAYGTVSQPVCLATLYLLFKSPSRVIIPHSGRRVWVKGRGAGWLIWCLHSTPQAATVRSRRLPISPLVLIGVSRVIKQTN